MACAECPLHGSDVALAGTPAAMFCVFDGHCGRSAADAANTVLPDEVSDRLADVKLALAAGQGAAGMLREAFLATDERIATEEGCTATALLMWRDSKGDVCLQAANVGDTSALLIDPAAPAPPGPQQQQPQVLHLTEDHRLTNPGERARLAALGIQLGDNARRLYGLNLSRGLGDKFLKDEDLGRSQFWRWRHAFLRCGRHRSCQRLAVVVVGCVSRTRLLVSGRQGGNDSTVPASTRQPFACSTVCCRPVRRALRQRRGAHRRRPGLHPAHCV